MEDRTLDARKDAANEKLFTFAFTGSKTGPDGEGRSDAWFVSKSGRVVIAPENWNVAYATALAGIKPAPEQFAVKWKVEPRFVDEFASPGAQDTAIENVITLASGLPNTKHTLKITSSPATPNAALRIYQPPLGTESDIGLSGGLARLVGVSRWERRGGPPTCFRLRRGGEGS